MRVRVRSAKVEEVPVFVQVCSGRLLTQDVGGREDFNPDWKQTNSYCLGNKQFLWQDAYVTDCYSQDPRWWAMNWLGKGRTKNSKGKTSQRGKMELISSGLGQWLETPQWQSIGLEQDTVKSGSWQYVDDNIPRNLQNIWLLVSIALKEGDCQH